uniref:Uncharacterized protein n=1 Tax=Anguilla anguilla TaxID=7936 RepID=A0A0E9QVX9_ANGAN
MHCCSIKWPQQKDPARRKPAYRHLPLLDQGSTGVRFTQFLPSFPR